MSEDFAAPGTEAVVRFALSEVAPYVELLEVDGVSVGAGVGPAVRAGDRGPRAVPRSWRRGAGASCLGMWSTSSERAVTAADPDGQVGVLWCETSLSSSGTGVDIEQLHQQVRGTAQRARGITVATVGLRATGRAGPRRSAGRGGGDVRGA